MFLYSINLNKWALYKMLLLGIHGALACLAMLCNFPILEGASQGAYMFASK